MERFLATVTTRQWHEVQDRGGDPAASTRRLVSDHPGHEALIEAFYGRFDEMLDHAFPQMGELVERLHEAGTPLYLLSNAPGFLDAWLRGPAHRRHPFLGRFRDYVVSGLVGCCKPDATIYDLVCRTGGFSPGDAVLIDDNLPNIEGARAFGLNAIHHRSRRRDDRGIARAGAARLTTIGLPDRGRLSSVKPEDPIHKAHRALMRRHVPLPLGGEVG